MNRRFRTSFLLSVLIWLFVRSVSAQPYGLESRPIVGPFLNGALPDVAPTLSGNWSAVVAFPNLTFLNAIGLAHMPGTTKLVVWEREGRVYHFENNPGVATKTLVLNITNQCQGWDDSGLLGLAFHPGFATNRHMFVWYTWVTPGTVLGNATTRPPTATPNRDRLSRFTLDANGVAVPGSETVFIDQNSGTVWHNGGGMFFGDDGFLYITNGDDANGANDQRINVSLHSGVLRIDVDRRGGSTSHPIPRQPNNGVTANYYIPNSNPFVGQAGVLEEFFAIGLRSPHRMTFDPVSRRIFIGDVGEGSREEIDMVEPTEPFGLNFQWNRIEGLNGDLVPPYIGVNKRPILDYSHSEGFAVIGGHVYRGQQFATDLGGKYIFGDNGSKRIWVLNEGTIPATKTELCVLPPGPGPNPGNDYVGLSSFGLDANNEIYMCQMSSVGGRIYKLQRGGPTNAPLPRLLSQTGAFTNTAALGSAWIPYDVASPLWSDRAVKSRWMAIPTSRFINYSPTGEWTFPNGSVFVKHFELPISDTNPAIRKRLETRLLVRDTNGYVYGATYKWRADNSDADLLDSALTENIAVTTATGTRTQQWYYPSRTDCLACHTTAARGVLGMKTRQSNRDFHYTLTGVTDNQLRTWGHIGLLDIPPADPAIAALYKLVTVTNTSATLETRVRSYLDANCSHCHRPGSAQAFWDARFDTPLASQGIINGSVQNMLGVAGAKIVVPRNLARSILHVRDNSLDATIKMPPLAKNVIDASAMSVIAEWISTMPPDFGTVNLVATGSNWKYLDDGSNQGTNWVSINFNDTAWASGPAQLGYGDDDEATIVGYGPDSNNKYITTYFRHSFVVSNAASYTNLIVSLLRDDGAVVHLNGVEVFRSNMPEGAITSATTASGTVPTEDESTTYHTTNIPPARLRNGTNVLAVEIHQANNTSSDISFDLELNGFRNPSTNNNPPFVAITSPFNGATRSAPAFFIIGANATDNEGSVANVEFLANGIRLGEGVSAPFTLSWGSVPAGGYQLAAIATDNTGLRATSAVVNVTVTANNLPPQVVLTGPASNAVFAAPAAIPLSANASDVDGTVSKVEFYSGATKLGEDSSAPYSLVWSNVPAGSYTLTAVATDNNNGSAVSAPVPITVIVAPHVFTNKLISVGATWDYLDNGSDQGTAWRVPAFDDSGWNSGPAQLGYSSNPAENDEATFVSFGPDANNKYITTYFRHRFMVSAPGNYTNLTLQVLRDDGAIVYLNGTEVFRSNMPTNPVTYLTLASSAVTGAAEISQFFGTNIPPGVVVNGTNLIAVEIHQSGGMSSDISFDLGLTGIGLSNSATPTILQLEPIAANQFRLWFDAPSGQNYIIDATSDLQTWIPINTNSASSGLFEYLDTTTDPWRFYRARPMQ